MFFTNGSKSRSYQKSFMSPLARSCPFGPAKMPFFQILSQVARFAGLPLAMKS